MNVDDSDDRIDREIVEALTREARAGAPRLARERVFRRVTTGAAVLGAATTAGTGGAVAAVGTAASHSTFAVISALVVGGGIGFGTQSAFDAMEAPAARAPAASVAPAVPTAPRVQNAAPEPTVTVNPMPDLPEPGPTLAPVPDVAKLVPLNRPVVVPKIELPGLAAQQALLDEARGALRRHDGAGALSAIGAHRLRFPETALFEERSALEIRALAALGRVEEARRLYGTFVGRFPGSLFTESLRTVVAGSTGDSVTDGATDPQVTKDGPR